MFSIKSMLGFVGTLIFAVAMLNIHNIYALFWKAENTTVFLSKCKEDCTLKGTLRVKSFDGGLYLTNAKGSVTYLPDGSYREISYTTNALSFESLDKAFKEINQSESENKPE